MPLHNRVDAISDLHFQEKWSVVVLLTGFCVSLTDVNRKHVVICSYLYLCSSRINMVTIITMPVTRYSFNLTAVQKHKSNDCS